MAKKSRIDSPTGTQSVERVLGALEAVARAANGVEIADVAECLRVSSATAYRLVGVLQRQGYVVRGPDHRYRLGKTVGLLGLALQRQVLATPPIRRLLDAARVAAHAPVYLMGFVDGDVVVAHISDSVEHPRISQLHVGFAEANHATAFGKLMLAASPQLVERVERPALTRASITGSAPLSDELERVRRNQLSVEVEEYMPKLACIAAPVRSERGATIGAVSVSVSADDFRARADELELVVRRTALQVSSALPLVNLSE